MFDRTGIFQTKNISKWENSCRYIILHHTWVVWAGNLPILLWKNWSRVSAHFLITQDWKSYKLADPKQITWHAGKSQWWFNKNMNAHSLWIEIEGNGKTAFTDKQYFLVVELVKHLMKTYNIPIDNLLKHSDLTREWSSKMRLWDWKSPTRKVDLDRRFWADRGYSTFSLWRDLVFK